MKSKEQTLKLRKKYLGSSLSLAYDEPLKIVRGNGSYLYDENGREYLDCVNNISHVGHCHPAVIQAAHEQNQLLNTNTRYLHDNIIELAEKLTATLPEPLSVCHFVNSGSEANELALRMATSVTGNNNTIVLDHAYHGNTSSLINISPYKFNGKGGSGKPKHVEVVPVPDVFRGEFRDFESAGHQYAQKVKDTIKKQGGGSTFIAESLLGCGGQILLPNGFLQESFQHIRNAGGICISDEVQVGLGRVGSHFWGFESQNGIPDIVTIGKPLGNGHPIAAVITTAEIAAAFNNGMEYFNSFGGNPVSCAIALSVLKVIEAENLQLNAFKVGNYFMSGLKKLKENFEVIGDVRGTGLFIGIELVKDIKTREPSPEVAKEIINKMKYNGILISSDGPYNNVLKLKPPMVFSRDDAELVINCLEQNFRKLN
jgi:4-aminobutyrate aminotransferase-like enzyme